MSLHLDWPALSTDLDGLQINIHCSDGSQEQSGIRLKYKELGKSEWVTVFMLPMLLEEKRSMFKVLK